MRLSPELLLLVAAASTACAGARPPVAPVAPVPLAASEVTIIAGMLAMQDHRVLDRAQLERGLAHARPEVRVQAALAAGRIGDPSAASALRAAVGDSAPEVAATAAFALGELPDSSAATLGTLTALASPAGWSRMHVAAEAVHALGKIGGSQGPVAIWPALTGGAPTAVLHEALLAIWKLPRSPQAVDAVVAHLAAADAETRWRAAYALMQMAHPSSVTALRSTLGDADHRVRANAARALRAGPVDSAGQRAPTRAALTAALADSVAHVVINAARALATFGDSTDIPPLAALLGAPDPNVAISAAQALGALAAPAAAGPLAAAAGNTALPLGLRATALASHAAVAPGSAVDRVGEWAGSPDWLERFYAARALSGAPWDLARPVLGRLARDTDARVAAAALSAIVATADTVVDAYAFYVEGLGAADVMVRAAAARGIARRPRPMDLPLLLLAYERATSDSLGDAALATVEALGALRATGVPAERSFFVRFERSPDVLVRRSVAAALGDDWGPVLPAETGRSAADYENVVRSLMAPAIEQDVRPRVRIGTGRGDIVLELAPLHAPLTTANLLDLARSGFFRGPNLRWHRVVPNFVLQDGDPRGDGSGGPAHAIRDEMNRLRYGRGVLGMALAGPDTGGSQFFITHSPQPHLDGGYTVFGRVVEGMAVVDAIVQDDPILAIEVVQ